MASQHDRELLPRFKWGKSLRPWEGKRPWERTARKKIKYHVKEALLLRFSRLLRTLRVFTYLMNPAAQLSNCTVPVSWGGVAKAFVTCVNSYQVAQQRNSCKSFPVSFPELHQNVLNVLAYNPINNVYYGISSNKKTFLRSKSFPFLTWSGISNNIWFRVKGSPSLITATEVPFIPALPGRVHEPFAALTMQPFGASLKRRPRSVTSIDMWGCNYLTVLYYFSSCNIIPLVLIVIHDIVIGNRSRLGNPSDPLSWDK